MQDTNAALLCIMQYLDFVSSFLENPIANMQDNASVKQSKTLHSKYEAMGIHFLSHPSQKFSPQNYTAVTCGPHIL